MKNNQTQIPHLHTCDGARRSRRFTVRPPVSAGKFNLLFTFVTRCGLNAVLLLLSAILYLPATSFAQSYSIDWYKIAGGGGTSSNGQYAVSGTIGQHDAGGPMTNEEYSVTGGFWSPLSVVQTAGAPTLYISRTGNTVSIHWQAAPGWTLQQNDSLSVPANWAASGYTITTTNGTNSIALTAPQGNLFFRLQPSP